MLFKRDLVPLPRPRAWNIFPSWSMSLVPGSHGRRSSSSAGAAGGRVPV
jgi:hypothetical protein